jgi:hypothetical protein
MQTEGYSGGMAFMLADMDERRCSRPLISILVFLPRETVIMNVILTTKAEHTRVASEHSKPLDGLFEIFMHPTVFFSL